MVHGPSCCCQLISVDLLRMTSAFFKNLESIPSSPQRRKTDSCQSPAHHDPDWTNAWLRVWGNFSVCKEAPDPLSGSFVNFTNSGPSGREKSGSSTCGTLSFSGSGSSSNSSWAMFWISVKAAWTPWGWSCFSWGAVYEMIRAVGLKGLNLD